MENDAWVRFPTLRTERLILRQMTERDADNLYNIYAGGQVARFLDWDGPESVQQARELILDWNRFYENRALLPWGIAMKTDDELIGTIMYMPLRGTFETKPLFPVTIGFDLSQPCWNQGIMSEALAKVTDYGVHQIGAHRIQADVVPENGASIHILKKAGFKCEGLLRKYLKHEVTQLFLDVIVLALITS